ncbi:hypothetical protein OEZ78_26875, partial [Leclercia adecarboxylata]|uniref:hypothetical protein n=1 Tax=Leclercia adecarboxylata TaxID=83655 RepID=UPI00234CAE57
PSICLSSLFLRARLSGRESDPARAAATPPPPSAEALDASDDEVEEDDEDEEEDDEEDDEDDELEDDEPEDESAADLYDDEPAAAREWLVESAEEPLCEWYLYSKLLPFSVSVFFLDPPHPMSPFF